MPIPSLEELRQFKFNLKLNGPNVEPDGSDDLKRLFMSSLDVTHEPFGMNESGATPALESLQFEQRYNNQYSLLGGTCLFYHEDRVYLMPSNAGESGELLEKIGFTKNDHIPNHFATGLTYLAKPRTLIAKMSMDYMHDKMRGSHFRNMIETALLTDQRKVSPDLCSMEDLGSDFIDIGGLVYWEGDSFYAVQDPFVNFLNRDVSLALTEESGLTHSRPLLQECGLGAFNVCNGFVAFIDPFGRFCIGAATEGNIQNLTKSGYQKYEDLDVPSLHRSNCMSWETAILVWEGEQCKNVRWAYSSVRLPNVDEMDIAGIREDPGLPQIMWQLRIAANAIRAGQVSETPKVLQL